MARQKIRGRGNGKAMGNTKPLVIVTRKLPEPVEARMRELFDARFNESDRPMSPAELAEAIRDRRRAGAHRHRPHRRADHRPGRRAI